MDGRVNGKPFAGERGSGIDFRNPVGVRALPQAVRGTVEQVTQFCAREPDCLAHLYWPGKEHYFEENRKRLREEGRWLLVATPGHGLRQSPRPSVNFFVADQRFAKGYPAAAQERRLRHGLLIDHDLISAYVTGCDYELAEVEVRRHPNAIPDHTEDQDWQFDIGKQRHRSMMR